MRSSKLELLVKVVAWRTFSMTYGFGIAYLFTGNAAESIGIVIMTGTTLTLLQWGFEIIWDKYVRSTLRNAISGKHGGAGGLVRWGRDSRAFSMDEHQ